jgi:hypothetical protein
LYLQTLFNKILFSLLEYCLAKAIEQVNQTQSQSEIQNLTDPFTSLQCDECYKQVYNNFKNYQSSHPLDTPNLQKILSDDPKEIKNYIEKFENKCPNLITTNTTNIVKSDGQILSNQFYNYPGIILIGLLGFIYVNIM